MKATPDQHDPDWSKYPETVLFFSSKPPLQIDLRAVPSPNALKRLGELGLMGPFAILTAFDPRGEDLEPSENDQRRRALESRLRADGYRFLPVDCCSPDRSHCECSVAVVMPRDSALELARELEQVALFWFDGTRFWILGALVDTDPLMLPRSS